MIDIYIASIQKMNEHRYIEYLNLLPSFMQQEVTRYHQLSDRYRTLLGKIILHRYLQKHSNLSLDDVIKNEYGKPYIKEWDIDFNISHSGEYVVCAFNDEGKVGIDIEEQKKIELEDLRTIFTSKEWHEIKTASNSIEKFYQFWTAKEALLKYLGTGFFNEVQHISVEKEKLLFENQFYFYESLSYQGHTLSVVKPEAMSNIKIIELEW